MAAEPVAMLGPHNAYRETALGYDKWSYVVPLGDNQGLRLNKLDTCGYTWIEVIPGSITMGTGLTFTFMMALPPTPDYSDDPGKVLRLGVTVKRLIDGESLDFDTAAATEQTKDITVDATAGLIDVSTLAVANANLDSAVVGNIIGIRIRRIGSATQDTLRGSAVLVRAGVANT